jgi:hypothetical protein
VTTALMYDSAGGNIPADAQYILVPTDGTYAAGVPAIKARFPNATYQTYSCDGQVPAEWVDCEPGCVWPPEAAVATFKAWQGNGITKGFYSTLATQTAIKQYFSQYAIDANTVEWFDADWTNQPHIDIGNTETQFEDVNQSYDISEIPVEDEMTPEQAAQLNQVFTWLQSITPMIQEWEQLLPGMNTAIDDLKTQIAALPTAGKGTGTVTGTLTVA